MQLSLCSFVSNWPFWHVVRGLLRRLPTGKSLLRTGSWSLATIFSLQDPVSASAVCTAYLRRDVSLARNACRSFLPRYGCAVSGSAPTIDVEIFKCHKTIPVEKRSLSPEPPAKNRHAICCPLVKSSGKRQHPPAGR